METFEVVEQIDSLHQPDGADDDVFDLADLVSGGAVNVGVEQLLGGPVAFLVETLVAAGDQAEHPLLNNVVLLTLLLLYHSALGNAQGQDDGGECRKPAHAPFSPDIGTAPTYELKPSSCFLSAEERQLCGKSSWWPSQQVEIAQLRRSRRTERCRRRRLRKAPEQELSRLGACCRSGLADSHERDTG